MTCADAQESLGNKANAVIDEIRKFAGQGEVPDKRYDS